MSDIGFKFAALLLMISSCVIKEKEAPGTKLHIHGLDSDGGFGLFDPSIAQDPKNSRLWLTYSVVDPSGADQWLGKFNRSVSSRLAFSDDGVNWRDVTRLSPAFPEVVQLTGSSQSAVWGSETSSLVYDRSATEAERWKVIWHRFLTVEGLPRFDFSWLSIKVAAGIESLASAPEEKLVGSYLYNPINDSHNSHTKSPVKSPPFLRVDAMHESLSTSICVEPSFYSTETHLYLAMACNDIENKFWRIPLFSCKGPCAYEDPAAWTHVTDLLTTDVAKPMGYNAFSAPNIFEKDGRRFIIATPVINKGGSDSHYSGCQVFEFEDIDAGTLFRDTVGNPKILQTVSGLGGSFHGACGYHAGMEGSGIMYSQLHVEHAMGFFSIYQSHLNVP